MRARAWARRWLVVATAGACAVPITGASAAAAAPALCAPALSGGPRATATGGFHPTTPTRVLDTRRTTGAVAAGCGVVVDLASLVPLHATAAAFDVAAVDASGAGFVTAYSCDTARPLASNLNPTDAAPTANAVIVALGASRRVCVHTSVQTELVVDMTGWFGPGGASFHGAEPTRLLDTRKTLRPDGRVGRVTGGTAIRLAVAGTNAVPAGATAVAVNLTVTNTAAPGYVTAYPCGEVPVASNVNYLAGETNANAAIVGLDRDGGLCVFTLSTVDLVVDVTGWFGGTDGSRFGAITAARVLDTRDGTGGRHGPIGAGETIEIDPSLGGDVGVGADVALDVVANEPAGTGFLTLYPCGAAYPASTSTVNFLAGADAANLAVIPAGAGGRICLYSMTATHVVIDVLGSFGPVGALRSLSVSGGDLVPPFSPDGHDYGVICAPGANTWSIATSAATGSQVTVRGAASGTVTVAENDAAVVVATLPDGRAEEYWIRCLPHDFPTLIVDRPEDPAPGWYLAGTTAGPAGTQYAVILDDHGAAVWYHKTPPGLTSFDVKRLPNGHVAWIDAAGAFGADPTRAYQERSLDGATVRTWATVGTPTDHHEMLPLDNGNMLMASYHQRSNVDVSALGPGFTSPNDVLDAWIQEVRPDGTVAWEWRSEDHIGVGETRGHLDGLTLDTARGLDLVHLNSLAVNPADGNVVVSFRHLDAVLEVRRKPDAADDGTVAWKLGGNEPSDPATLHWTIVDPLGGPRRQHDARILPDGHLTLYDNQTGHAGQRSRAVEYELDARTGTARLMWQYESPDTSPAFCCGSTRRSGDGSTVIGWGGSSTMFTDVGPAGLMTLQVAQEPSGFSYRVVKEPPEAFDRATLRATAGRPVS